MAKRVAAWAAILVVSGSVAWRVRGRFSDSLTVTFFDVGQGDAALLQLPGGASWLVDGGGGIGEWDVGERALVPELARLAILRLDGILLSHPDQDHAMGLRGVLRAIPTTELWLSAVFAREPTPLLSELSGLATEKGAAVRAWSRPFTVFLSGVRFDLWPVPGRGRRANDRCLAARVSLGSCAVLFLGDLEEDGETWLRRHAPAEVTVLKAAHHGSRTSSHLPNVLAWRPALSVLSLGKNNSYGHPHPTAVTHLLRASGSVLRTDYHGYVQVRFSTGRYSCISAQGPCGEGPCVSGPLGARNDRGSTRAPWPALANPATDPPVPSGESTANRAGSSTRSRPLRGGARVPRGKAKEAARFRKAGARTRHTTESQ